MRLAHNFLCDTYATVINLLFLLYSCRFVYLTDPNCVDWQQQSDGPLPLEAVRVRGLAGPRSLPCAVCDADAQRTQNFKEHRGHHPLNHVLMRADAKRTASSWHNQCF